MELKKSLRGIVGDENVSDSPEDLEPYNTHDKVVDMFAPEWREKYRF